jgi:hypothetical protein
MARNERLIAVRHVKGIGIVVFYLSDEMYPGIIVSKCFFATAAELMGYGSAITTLVRDRERDMHRGIDNAYAENGHPPKEETKH